VPTYNLVECLTFLAIVVGGTVGEKTRKWQGAHVRFGVQFAETLAGSIPKAKVTRLSLAMSFDHVMFGLSATTS
jgi:hypothetical protein